MSVERETVLRGRRILIVEDQALVALDLQATLEERGAAVVGPCLGAGEAADAIRGDGEPLDAAILDADLGAEDVLSLADRLLDRGVPLVFHTDRADLSHLGARYDRAVTLLKPSRSEDVAHRITSAIADRGDDGAAAARPASGLSGR